MASVAEKTIRSETVFITTEVICEIVYVLEKVYSIPRTKIHEALQRVLENIDSEYKEALRAAFQVFTQRKLDFVDCLLFGYHVKNGWEVRTFDKKLEKLIATYQ